MSSIPPMDRIREAQISASHSSDASVVIRGVQAYPEYRSIINFIVNLPAGLVVFCRRPNKPSIQIDPNHYRPLVALTH